MSRRISEFILIAVCILSLVLSVKVFSEKPDGSPVINTYEVSGFSTDFTQVVASCKTAIVRITVGSDVCGGFVYKNENGVLTIVTCFHGLQGHDNVNVCLDNGISGNAVVLGYDPYVDMAVLQMETDYSLSPLSLADSRLLKAGEFLISIGCTRSLEFSDSVSLGMVSSPLRCVSNSLVYQNDQREYFSELIQLSGSYEAGFSGSPVLNMKGEVAGMVLMKDGDIPFALTANEISILTECILNDMPAEKLQLGFKGSYLNLMEPYYKSSLSIPLDLVEGIYVESLKSTSLAASLGIKSGDIILAVNGKTIKDFADYLSCVYEAKDFLEITVYRAGEEFVLQGEI